MIVLPKLMRVFQRQPIQVGHTTHSHSVTSVHHHRRRHLNHWTETHKNLQWDTKTYRYRLSTTTTTLPIY